jgi:hypothetical protein
LCCFPLVAQVEIGAAPVDTKIVKSVLGRRAAKAVNAWTVVLRNTSSTTVIVSEDAVMRELLHMQPIGGKMLEQYIRRVAGTSPLARAGRVTMDMALLASFLGAGGTIAMNDSWLAALAGFAAHAPHISERITSTDVPVLANFGELRSSWPVKLGPGQAGSSYIFTAYQKDRDAGTVMHFSIDTSRMEGVRYVE